MRCAAWLRAALWSTLTVLLVAVGPAQAEPLTIDEARTQPESVVEPRLAESHPSALYAYAMRKFEQGKKNDAVTWFYAGQLRYRCFLGANPTLSLDGDPAVMASLNATIGPVINEWAGGSPREWAASMQKALDWDDKSPDAFTPKEKFGALRAEVRSGLAALAKQVLESEEAIRAQRKANGLENR